MTTITPSFPQTLQANLILEGPAGNLELLTSYPEVPRNPPIIAVICHPHPLFGGNLHNKVIYILARSFHALGLSSVRFNFRGVGKSQGHYDHGIGETDDLLAVLQWLKNTCANPTIWLAGFSFGAYVAARAVKQAQTGPRPIEQLICVAP